MFKELVPIISQKKLDIEAEEVRLLIREMCSLFRSACIKAGHNGRNVTAVMTKFRDAGRRSAPWRPTSSRVPGRPQDGADGNRINRWLLPRDHKFYATEVVATLVEVKYILQSLSMDNAPIVEDVLPAGLFTPWLLENDVRPGAYVDPVQLVPINFHEFISNPRAVQSGHLNPLDRGGKHTPDNTFLMLSRSNQLQGNLTVQELIDLMRTIVQKHDEARKEGALLERSIAKH